MKQKRIRCLSLLLLILAARLGAQEYNSVPLDHDAYNIIAIGIMRGVISPPYAAKPWPLYIVKEKLWEMANDPAQILSSDEAEAVFRVYDSFERKTGFQLQDGRYRTKNYNSTFEIGMGWESDFSTRTSGGSFANGNILTLYSGGDIEDFASWNISPRFYADWPDEPAFTYGLDAELNGAFFGRRLLLRLGRVRRGWGSGSGDHSLFMNAHASPFTALDGTFSPQPWLNISFLGGALERFGKDVQWPDEFPFTNALTAAQVEFNPSRYFHFNLGGAAVLLNQPNAALFGGLEFRMLDLFTLWGSFFIDRIDSPSANIFSMNGRSYAYQAGIRTVLHWLPLAAFTLQYTSIEPYCYAGKGNSAESAFISGGESLGYYLPPNSDELLIRFEFMFLAAIKTYVQFQMIRHGVDYGYGAVPGSSLYSTWDDDYSAKYFLRDGVYRWDNMLKLGASCNLKSGGANSIPLSIYGETGLVVTNFTINGDAGVGHEAGHEPLSDSVYQPDTYVIFSIGFRLFL